MPTTPSERKALLFLSGLLVLGAGVRVAGAVRGAPPPPDERSRAALERQIKAVDSARKSAHRPHDRSRRPKVLGRVEQRRDSVPRVAYVLPEVGKVDLDVATAAEIERLPRIGPSLARRIVADRDSLGPFGSLEGFGRVRGVGPGLIKTVAPLVTFSLPPRPSPEDDRGDRAPAGRARRGSRKPRSP
jgi:competence protein ComEA